MKKFLPVFLAIAMILQVVVLTDSMAKRKRLITELEYQDYFNSEGSTSAALELFVKSKRKIKILNIPAEIKYVKLGDLKKKKVNKNQSVTYKIKAAKQADASFITLQGFMKRKGDPVLLVHMKLSSIGKEDCGPDGLSEVCGDLTFIDPNGVLNPVTLTKKYNNTCDVSKAGAVLSEDNSCLDQPGGQGIIGTVRLRGKGRVTIPSAWPSTAVINQGPDPVQIHGATPKLGKGGSWNAPGGRYDYTVFGNEAVVQFVR